MAAIESSEYMKFVASLTEEQRGVLRVALAAAWREGYQWCYDDGGDTNPYLEGNPFTDTRDA